MCAFARKLLASLVAIAMIAAVVVGFVAMGPIQAQSPACPLNEDFSGFWLPAGWTQEQVGEWTQGSSSYAGGTSPEAVLDYDDISGGHAYLDSKPVDTAGATSLMLGFKSFVDDYCCSDEGSEDIECGYGQACGEYFCTVYMRANATAFWIDVTPWSNPIYGDVGPGNYTIDISPYIGTATQVRFEFDGYSYALSSWYLDDVQICGDIPQPVGGTAYPTNKLLLVLPWVGLAAIAGVPSLLILRRRRVQS
jgi:hypothetical protein